MTLESSSLQWNVEVMMAHRVISENVVEEKEVTDIKKTVVLDAGANDSSK